MREYHESFIMVHVGATSGLGVPVPCCTPWSPDHFCEWETWAGGIREGYKNAELLGMSCRITKWRRNPLSALLCSSQSHLATKLCLPHRKLWDKGSHRELDLFLLGSPSSASERAPWRSSLLPLESICGSPCPRVT